MPYLIKGANVFTPKFLGKKDVLILEDKIAAIEDDLSQVSLPNLEVIEAKGLNLTPGFMDQHVHITGGGGEGGPETRCPELQLSELILCGTTSVVGVLGTDGLSRTPSSVLTKSRALKREGISAWMHTSSYLLPPQTLTGSVKGDLYCVPEVLGVKIALGDHRSSFPTAEKLLEVLTDIRVSAMLAGKIGFLHIHLGDVPGAFNLLEEIVDRGFPIKHIRPMHVARKKWLLQDAIGFARKGGFIDVTSGGICDFSSPADAVEILFDEKVPPHLLTMSTDGHGSKPRFNENGELIGLRCGGVTGNLDIVRELIGRGHAPEKILPLVTSNVADALGLGGKGKISAGFDADICFFDTDCDWKLRSVFARGKQHLSEGKLLKKGTFEEL